MFGRHELPYGVAEFADGRTGVVVAVADGVVDLSTLWATLALDGSCFNHSDLNTFLALGPSIWEDTRARLLDLIDTDGPLDPRVDAHSVPVDQVRLLLPIVVADYVDCYASAAHAGNLGRILRPGTEPLTPNWRHLPVGYHGRSGTIVVSGTPVARPSGQSKAPDADLPHFGPTARLDIEAELGWVVGVGSTLGTPVPLEQTEEHLFGVVLLNDWSARDLQGWEYVPLGPYLGKSFATSISAWVLPVAALTEAAVPLPESPVPLLPYLAGATHGYDIVIEVELNGEVISRCPAADLAWSPAQFLAHATVNGASLRTGDLFGSGTVSGTGSGQQGSLIELTWNGRDRLTLADGSTRGFLDDGDEVVLRAVTGRGRPIRLGEVRGRIRD